MTFQLCPVCKEKMLTGGHGAVCILKRPVDWVKYYRTLHKIELGRMGRVECLEKLANVCLTEGVDGQV